jgi:hypothetical protein
MPPKLKGFTVGAVIGKCVGPSQFAQSFRVAHLIRFANEHALTPHTCLSLLHLSPFTQR